MSEPELAHVPVSEDHQISQEVAVTTTAPVEMNQQPQILEISPGQFVQLITTSSHASDCGDNNATTAFVRCQPVGTNEESVGGEMSIEMQTVLGSIPEGYHIVSLKPLVVAASAAHSNELQGAYVQVTDKSCNSGVNEDALIQYDSQNRNNLANKTRDNLNLSKDGNQGCSWEPTVTVQISESDSASFQKFYFPKTLCRVCLVEKECTTSIFENLTVDEKGMVENSKGPKAVRYNILPALQTLLDVKVKVGDGLPTQICTDCLDRVIEFSAFRRQIAIGQEKLRGIISQVSSSNNPTLLISIGEPDFRRTDMFKHPEWILQAKNLITTSSYCHLVQRLIPDRVWDKMFSTMSEMMGAKSNKLNSLEKFVLPGPNAVGWFCATCNLTIHDGHGGFETHCYSVHGVENRHAVYLPCDICGNSYSIKDATGMNQSYVDHWLQHFYFYECDECFKRFPSHKSLWAHVKASHRSSKNSNSCEACGRCFSSKSALEAHKKTHLDKDERLPFLNVCSLCGKGLTGNLQAHMDSVHYDKRPFKCDICEKSFTRKEILTSHKALVHLNIKKYKCDTCEKLFKSSTARNIHLLRHKGEKPHVCLFPDCGQRFYSAKALRSHSLKHQEIGTFKCHECGKCFKRRRYLEEHSTLHTGIKPYECGQCGKQIRMKSNYYKHLKTHERKKPEDTQKS